VKSGLESAFLSSFEWLGVEGGSSWTGRGMRRRGQDSRPKTREFASRSVSFNAHFDFDYKQLDSKTCSAYLKERYNVTEKLHETQVYGEELLLLLLLFSDDLPHRSRRQILDEHHPTQRNSSPQTASDPASTHTTSSPCLRSGGQVMKTVDK
jgi:hypothetical protein